MQDRVLVILIEERRISTLSSPDVGMEDDRPARCWAAQLRPYSMVNALAEKVRDWIKAQTDRLIEDAELSLGRLPSHEGHFAMAMSSCFATALASYDDLKCTLIACDTRRAS